MNTRGSLVVLSFSVLAAVVFLLQGCTSQQPKYAQVRAQVHKLSLPMRGSGSGVVLRPGLVLTAGHVAARNRLVISDAPVFDPIAPVGKSIAVGGTGTDLGLVQYPDTVGCPCVKLADHDAEIDEPVVVVGYPYGGIGIVTEGRAQGVMPEIGLVVTAPVASGNSGGGAFVFRNGEWQLIGIVVAAAPEGTLTLVVPVSKIKEFLAANT